MKMNSLSALIGLLRRVVGDVPEPEGVMGLVGYEAQRHDELVEGKSIGEAGCESILCMRDYQRDKVLPERLIIRVEAMGKAPMSR